MWIFKKLSSLLSALPSSLTIYFLCVCVGAGLGGYSVHKLYDLKEVTLLRKQAVQREADRTARFASTREAAQLARKRSTQIAAIKREVIPHVPRTPACRLNRDTVRLLNELRGEM